MAAVVVLLSVVVAIVIALLIGLLRAHAEVLRKLHELGAGIGAPSGSRASAAAGDGVVATAAATIDLTDRVAAGVAPPRPSDAAAAHDVVGVTPSGSAVSVPTAGRLTLLAFLTTGCTTCADFWRSWREGRRVVVPAVGEPRVVIVTRGPANEHVAAVADLAPPGTTVVMSTDAWADYAVPASPYFVLIDPASRVIGEGSAASFDQLLGVLQRAQSDSLSLEESRIDRDLRRAGITPGHASLYDWSAGPAPQ